MPSEVRKTTEKSMFDKLMFILNEFKHTSPLPLLFSALNVVNEFPLKRVRRLHGAPSILFPSRAASNMSEARFPPLIQLQLLGDVGSLF